MNVHAIRAMSLCHPHIKVTLPRENERGVLMWPLESVTPKNIAALNELDRLCRLAYPPSERIADGLQWEGDRATIKANRQIKRYGKLP